MARFMDSGNLAFQDVVTKKDNGRFTGIFTCAAVSPGNRLITEEPLMIFDDRNGDPTEDDVYEAVMKDLAPGDRVHFCNLPPRDENDPNRLLSIWEAHCFKLPDGRQLYFPVISIIQHSCSPNAIADWNSSIGCLTITVVQNLEVNTPLTISYVNPLLPLQERFLSLRDDFGVTCMCPRCAPIPQLRLFPRYVEEEYLAWERILRSDQKRIEIEDLLAEYDEIERVWREETGGYKAYELLNELAHLYKRCARAISYGPQNMEEIRVQQIEDQLEHKHELLEDWKSIKYGSSPLELINRLTGMQNGDLVAFAPVYRRASQYACDEGNFHAALQCSNHEIWDLKRYFGKDSPRMRRAKRDREELVAEASRWGVDLNPRPVVSTSRRISERAARRMSGRVSKVLYGHERRNGRVLARERHDADRSAVRFY